MKLKEFVIWGYKLSLEDSRKFNLFNRCVCAHFERHFKAFDADGIYRVVLKVSDDCVESKEVEISSSVLKFYKKMNFEIFNSLSENERKEFILNLLYESMLELSAIRCWDVEPFEYAFAMVKKEKIVNNYIYKTKFRKDRKLCAMLTCEHTPSYFKCNLEVVDNEECVVLSKTVFTEQPDEFLFNGRLGDIKWLDSNHIIVLAKDKTEIGNFEV